MQPVTPPRTRTRSSNQRTVLHTPTRTPFGKKLDLNNSIHKPKSPPPFTINELTPPATTPRHSSRKIRDHLGDALTVFPTPSSQRSLFPPTPSTIGSGRSKNLLVPQNTIPFQLISPIKAKNEIIAERQLSPVIAPTKRRLVFGSDSEDDVVEGEAEGDANKGFGTPRSKLINDDLVQKWNQEKFDSDDEDDSEVFIRREKLSNPFNPPSSKQTQGPVIRRNLPKQTEITLINKKGEKIIRKLTEEEQAYKPRNLFDSLSKSTSKIDVFRDEA